MGRDVQAHNPLHTWHLRLGHASTDTLKSMTDAHWLTIPNFKSLAALRQTPCTDVSRPPPGITTIPRSPAARNATRGNVPDPYYVDLMFLPIPKQSGLNPPSQICRTIAKCYYSGFTFIAFIPGKREGSMAALSQFSAVFVRMPPTPITFSWWRKEYSKAMAWLNSQESNSHNRRISAKHRRIAHPSPETWPSTSLPIATLASFAFDAFAAQIWSCPNHQRDLVAVPHQEYFGKDPTRSINHRTFGSIVYPSKIASKPKQLETHLRRPRTMMVRTMIDPTTQGSKSWRHGTPSSMKATLNQTG